MRRFTLLAIMASVMVMMFALTLGSASADGSEFFSDTPKDDGINQAAGSEGDAHGGEAWAPIFNGAGPGGADSPGGDQFNPALNNNGGAARDGVTRNPLCPLNDGWEGHP